MTGDQLEQVARQAMERAYAPYSRFRVGAAVAARDGRVFPGCNVENASYPVGICAERTAIAGAVAQGAREFDRMVLVTEAEEATPPCGLCRQVLYELAPGLEITSLTTSGARATWRIAELLPHPFTGESLADGPTAERDEME